MVCMRQSVQLRVQNSQRQTYLIEFNQWRLPINDLLMDGWPVVIDINHGAIRPEMFVCFLNHHFFSLFILSSFGNRWFLSRVTRMRIVTLKKLFAISLIYRRWILFEEHWRGINKTAKRKTEHSNNDLKLCRLIFFLPFTSSPNVRQTARRKEKKNQFWLKVR